MNLYRNTHGAITLADSIEQANVTYVRSFIPRCNANDFYYYLEKLAWDAIPLGEEVELEHEGELRVKSAREWVGVFVRERVGLLQRLLQRSGPRVVKKGKRSE